MEKELWLLWLFVVPLTTAGLRVPLGEKLREMSRSFLTGPSLSCHILIVMSGTRTTIKTIEGTNSQRWQLGTDVNCVFKSLVILRYAALSRSSSVWFPLQPSLPDFLFPMNVPQCHYLLLPSLSFLQVVLGIGVPVRA